MSIPLLVPKICNDCGAKLTTDTEWEEHYRFCTGPQHLEFAEDGSIYVRPGDCE